MFLSYLTLTLISVPGRPAGIKALTVNNSSVAVSWRPPDQKNGILTTYNLYYSNLTDREQVGTLKGTFIYIITNIYIIMFN